MRFSHSGRGRSRKYSVGLIAAGVIAVCAVFPQIWGDVLLAPLIDRFPRADLSISKPAGIVVLGGSEERLAEVADLATRLPSVTILVSGAGEEANSYLFRDRRIARERVIIEETATNTYENAVFSQRAARLKGGSPWLLVTSAYHMPRAIGAFRKAGFCVDPWPVYHLIPSRSSSAYIAVREWLALLAYRIRGMTDELFPAPETNANSRSCRQR